ncbi:MAG: alpha/beta fold hydrolase [Beijerinckiaceae bacterium]|nr:alpha/beta fold hydrolase [Beijerinckiaceae bacterium]MCI0736602.1 alpha/beta fold hydrolase [Beijerinckiaceae bacterium]
MLELHCIYKAREATRGSAVFIHGLGGDAYSTWGADKDDKSSFFWPLSLALDLEGLSVYSVGCEASLSGWRGSAMDLVDSARDILNRLLREPELQCGPVVLIGHGLGSLVIKRLMRTAESEALIRGDAARFLRRVEKAAFLAAPHTGSRLTSAATYVCNMVRISPAAASIVRNDPHLRELNQWYRNFAHSRKIAHLVFTETKPAGFFGRIVDLESSGLGLAYDQVVPVDSDHMAIAKPKSRDSEVYVHVQNFLNSPAGRPVPRLHADAKTATKTWVLKAA